MEVNDRITSVKNYFMRLHFVGACVVQFKGDLVQLRCLDGEYRWLPGNMIDRYCSEPHWIAIGRPGVTA
jgi:hypothetical protein